MKKLTVSRDALSRLNNAPVKVPVTGDKFWNILVNRKGKLECELWSEHQEDHHQDTRTWSDEKLQFYPFHRYEYANDPCVLLIYPDRIRRYTPYAYGVLLSLKLDEIYTQIQPVYAGWEIDQKNNRVHSDIWTIEWNGKLRFIDTHGWDEQYWMPVSSKVEVMLVNYTNTGTGKSKLCLYVRGGDVSIQRHLSTVCSVIQKLGGKNEY